MIKKICDKCGTEINTNPMINASLPTYTIYKYYGFPLYSKEINLCSTCEKLFDRWLNEENKNDR